MYRALIVCNYRFPESKGSLDELQGPKKDGMLLRDALTDHDSGMFDKGNVQHPLNDAPSGEILVATEEFFRAAEPDDILLFYYSGHGRTLDQQLYLCAHNTNPELLRSTAVPGNLLNDIVGSSLARVKILVLDCCYSAMFKGDDEAEITGLFGTGRYVLAATSAIERAADGAQKGLPSPFTKALAEALTGKAEDLDGDGKIDLDDVYRYLKTVVFESARPHQNYEGAGSVHIARRPVKARRHPPEARPRGNDAETNHTFHSHITGTPYLDRPAPGTSFSPELVAGFRARMREEARKSMPDSLTAREFLEHAGLIQSGVITYAGVLLFGSRPTAVLPAAVVQCVRFHGITNTALHDAIIDMHDTIPQLIERAYDFVAGVARIGEAPTERSPRAEPVYGYPMVALREIIANAVVHRDYEDEASNVQIFAFDDRIEVLSPGAWHGAPAAPGELPLGGLARRSRRRNFRIAQTLTWSPYFEGLGTGVLRSVVNCEELGAPEPLVVTDEDSVRVTLFPRPQLPADNPSPDLVTTGGTMRIALWGAPASGKTTYLAALRHDAASRAGDEIGTWKIIPRNEASEQLLTQWTQQLVELQEFPEVTALGSLADMRWHFIGDLSGSRYARRRLGLLRRPALTSEFDLDLIDVSGEAFGYQPADRHVPESTVRRTLAHLAGSDGLIFLFDPITGRDSPNVATYAERVLNNLSRQVLSEGRMVDGYLPHHIAICITKTDDPELVRGARRAGLLSTDPDGIDRVLNQQAEALFNAICENGFWEGDDQRHGGASFVRKQLRTYFHPKRTRYYAVSAIGHQNLAARNGVVKMTGPIRPFNMLEPLVELHMQLRNQT